MQESVLIVLIVEPAESKDQDTGKAGGIFSKAPTRAYTDGWDRIFGSKEEKPVAAKDLN
jgi:hypothetical protein